MKHLPTLLLANCFYLHSAAVFPVIAQAQDINWIRQFGSTSSDSAWGAAVDSNGVYVAGTTTGILPGQISAGSYDAFVRKYDTNGTEQWTRQFGAAGGEEAHAVAVDATGVYVVGFQVAGAFVVKYDTNGTEQWTRVISASGDASAVADGVAVDSTGVYVVGGTNGALPGQTFGGGGADTFVRKYDGEGTVLWTREFGGGTDWAEGVAVDATGVYVVGTTDGTLPGQTSAGRTDAFVRKYSTEGNLLWTRQFGSSSYDSAEDVAIDPSGVYAVGYASASLPGQASAGSVDAFVRKYDGTNGNVLWTRQFGSTTTDGAHAAAANARGLYVMGDTFGTLPGQSGSGRSAFVRLYDPSGAEQWTRQFGSGNAYAIGAAAGPAGVYVVGGVDGALLGQTSIGSTDAFVAMVEGPTPAPAVFEGGVVSAASFALHPAPLAPGAIAAIFGSNLNEGTTVSATSFEADGKLGTTLGGASVKINATPAPMFASIHTPSYDQLTVQIPFEVAGQTSAIVEVTVAGQTSPPRNFFVDAGAPGVFTANQQGMGAGAITHLDGSPVTAQNPAHPDEAVVLYATGLGVLNPPLATGLPSSGNLTVIPATVTVDGVFADVSFSGATPTLVGLNQVNLRIPASTRTALDIPVVVVSGGRQSNMVTIAVAP